MKICKNGVDIILYPVTKCSQCELRTRSSVCIWSKIVGTCRPINCGSIMIDVLSGIFKLLE